MLSHCVGLTFPGMMLLPGSFAGNANSPNPLLGPLPSSVRSVAILFREPAIVLRQPLTSTSESCAASASNLFLAVTNGMFVSVAIKAAISTS